MISDVEFECVKKKFPAGIEPEIATGSIRAQACPKLKVGSKEPYWSEKLVSRSNF